MNFLRSIILPTLIFGIGLFSGVGFDHLWPGHPAILVCIGVLTGYALMAAHLWAWE
jgi:hypothetical protein